jgi:hypothetical protein
MKEEENRDYNAENEDINLLSGPYSSPYATEGTIPHPHPPQLSAKTSTDHGSKNSYIALSIGHAHTMPEG